MNKCSNCKYNEDNEDNEDSYSKYRDKYSSGIFSPKMYVDSFSTVVIWIGIFLIILISIAIISSPIPLSCNRLNKDKTTCNINNYNTEERIQLLD